MIVASFLTKHLLIDWRWGEAYFARKLLDLRASPELLARIENLRAKANTGKISQEEELEYKEFVEAIDIISLLQSKARKILADKD
jgi:hypothetical protein